VRFHARCTSASVGVTPASRFSQVTPSAAPTCKSTTSKVHAISHENGGATKADPHVSQFAIASLLLHDANLLQELANTPDAMSGGSCSTTRWSCFGTSAASANTHDLWNMPVLLFGGKFLLTAGTT